MNENEKTTINNAQYLRRRQIEVSNVDKKISNNQLKSVMADFLSETGERVKVEDLDKCHRLKKETTIIMEFGSRAKRDAVLIGRKNLKGKNDVLSEMGLAKSFISESMCFELRRLDYICRRLKKDKYIFDTWFFNGRLYVLKNDKGKRVQIQHMLDLLPFAVRDMVDRYLR